MFKYILVILPFIFNASLAWSSTHHPQEFLKKISGSKNEGEQIVQHYCATCHAAKPIIPLGAPRIGVSTDWDPRIKQGMDVLFKHTNEGINAMPSRGGCFECTDHQLMLAILAILPENNLKVHNKYK